MSKLCFDEQRGIWYRVLYTRRYNSYYAQENRLRYKMRSTSSPAERAELAEEIKRFRQLRLKNVVRKEVSPPTGWRETVPVPASREE